MYRCFIIVGPPSSGTRFLSRLFVDAGCDGDTGFVQSFDINLPSPQQNIVWKTHNNHPLDPVPGTKDLLYCVEHAVSNGYKPVVLLLFRDFYANALSCIQRKFHTDFKFVYDTLCIWFQETLEVFNNLDCDKLLISYDSLSVYGDAYLSKIALLLDFQFSKRSYAVNENLKYFKERSDMKTSDGYSLIAVDKSGIPFFVREGTVDINVLDEVILGDPYQLNNITLRHNPNIVDVGGHIGAFTKFSAWKWPYAKHYVYEANSRNWEVLEMNLQDIRHKVTLYKGALVGEEPVNKRLVINSMEADRVTGGWGIIYSADAYQPGQGEAFVPIEHFYYIRDLLPALDKIDLLKLDCEGSEFSIIMNMSEEELHKVDYLVCEVHCGALPHHKCTYQEFRQKILKQFICPQLDARPTCGQHELFNIVACNRKLLG